MNAQLKPAFTGLAAATAIALQKPANSPVYAKHVYAPTTPRATLPHLDHEKAIPSRRYIGKYYWDNYHGHWNKVVDVDEQARMWQIAKTDRHGHVIQKPIWSSSVFSAMCFADKPFTITRG